MHMTNTARNKYTYNSFAFTLEFIYYYVPTKHLGMNSTSVMYKDDKKNLNIANYTSINNVTTVYYTQVPYKTEVYIKILIIQWTSRNVKKSQI